MFKPFLSTGAAVAAVMFAAALAAGSAVVQTKVLKFIPQADLRILDPIATIVVMAVVALFVFSLLYLNWNFGSGRSCLRFRSSCLFQVVAQRVPQRGPWQRS